MSKGFFDSSFLGHAPIYFSLFVFETGNAVMSNLKFVIFLTFIHFYHYRLLMWQNFFLRNLQTGLRIGKAQKWWEKGLQPNMKEVTSAQDLVDSLLNAGDNLVVVDFFSPGCGGCKALHPKVLLTHVS